MNSNVTLNVELCPSFSPNLQANHFHTWLKSKRQQCVPSPGLFFLVWECVHTPCACRSTQRWQGPDGKVVGSRVCLPSPLPLSSELPRAQTFPVWPAAGPDLWWHWSHAARVCQEQIKVTRTWGADYYTCKCSSSQKSLGYRSFWQWMFAPCEAQV